MVPIPIPKTRAALLVNLIVGAAFTTATVWYSVWRADQPPWNPGGPLEGMPWPYLAWNWVAICPGPLIGTGCLLNVPLYFWRTHHERKKEAATEQDPEAPSRR
ncbi:MAG TPA: hypothetical protein VK689_03370 [Armatimonadota bacterium]|nr:hypothetical protein [Armatimonadota bacterium]